jgi:rubrerythrin
MDAHKNKTQEGEREMKLIRKIGQRRRDFRADYQCEFCHAIRENIPGYDDLHYYNETIPDMKCPSCGRSTNGMHAPHQHITPLIPEGMEI